MINKILLIGIFFLPSILVAIPDKESFLGIYESETPCLAYESKVNLEKRFRYIKGGVTLPFPGVTIGLGLRRFYDTNGIDLSLHGSAGSLFLEGKFSIIYLHKSTIFSKWYFGFGGSISLLQIKIFFRQNFVNVSPEFVLGREFDYGKNNIPFLQLQLSFPTIGVGKNDYYSKSHRFLLIPLATITYGWLF